MCVFKTIDSVPDETSYSKIIEESVEFFNSLPLIYR